MTTHRSGSSFQPSNGSEQKLRCRMLFAVLVLCFAVMLYRPLPPQFAAQSMADRVKMHIIEPALRVSYFYPSRLCLTASCMKSWTRFALSVMQIFIRKPVASHIQVNTEVWDDVPVRIYTPNNRSSDGAVIFIHGGGFVIGDTHLYDSLTGEMARRLDMVLISLEYRLAPEAPFPAGQVTWRITSPSGFRLRDCEKAVERFLSREYARFGVNPRSVVLMGDSAGGNLVTVIAQKFRYRNDLPPIKAQVLIYPLLQFVDLLLPSYQHYYREMDGLALIDPVSISYFYMMYAGIDMDSYPELAYAAIRNQHLAIADRQRLSDTVLNISRLPESFVTAEEGGDHKPRHPKSNNEQATTAISRLVEDPEFSPLMQNNLTGLPRTLMITCEFDVLRDEGALYVSKLQDADVPVTWKHYPQGFHAMLNFFTKIDQASEAIDYIAEWVLRTIDQDDGFGCL